MWFGTRTAIHQVADPSFGSYQTAWNNAGVSGVFQSGGGFNIPSPSSHKTYNMTWAVLDAKETHELTDIVKRATMNGEYLYFFDPFNVYNHAPEYVANPSLCLTGGPKWFRRGDVAEVSTPANDFKLPPKGVTFSSFTQTRSWFFLTPPNADVRVTVWGSSATNFLRVRRSNNTTVALPFHGLTGAFSPSTITNAGGGVSLEFFNNAEITLYGVLVEINPSHAATGWSHGEGTSGLVVPSDTALTKTGFSASRLVDKQALGLTLKETEGWTW